MTTIEARTDESPYLTVKELAARLKIKVKGVYNLRQSRKGPPALTVGRELRFPLVEVEKWEAARLAADAAALESPSALRPPEPKLPSRKSAA